MRDFKQSLSLFWLLMSAASVCAQTSPLRMDLKAALDLAESSNLELRAARQQRAVALAGLKIASQIPNPTVSVAAARDLPHESLLWDQPIELAGQRGKRRAVAQEEQKATELDIGVLARQIRRRTREAFYRAILSGEQTGQAKAALDLATRVAEVVRQRFEAGDVAQLEVIQAEVEVARATAEYEATVQTQKIADVQLAALLNLPLEGTLTLSGRLEDLPKAEALPVITGKALSSNGEVQRAAQEFELEQRKLALAKAQRIPNVSLQAGVDLNAPPDFNVGPRGQIAVSLPLFYHGQGEVAQSSARLEFLRTVLQARRTTASAEVMAAYYDFVAKAGQSEQFGRRIVPASAKLAEMAEDSYRSGKSNLLTLIDAQRRLNETRKSYLDSLFAVQSSFAALEEVVGGSLD